MEKQKGYCIMCGTEIIVHMCCNSFDCGCQGLPIEPPVCSEKCYDEMMEKSNTKKELNEAEILSIKRLRAKGVKKQDIADRIGITLEQLKTVK